MPLIAGYAHCYVESNSNFPVSDFLFARSQMGMSLAFHIVFAAIGISLPVLMVISEALYLRTGRPVFLERAKRWSRGAPFSLLSALCQERWSRLSSVCCGQASWKNRARSILCSSGSRIGLQNSFNFSNCLRIILRAVI
jgi:hypothetical protein